VRIDRRAALRFSRRIFRGGIGIADAKEAGVQGTITSRDVLLHSVTIVRLWGPAFYLRCLRAIASGRHCTFLEVLAARR
jgi:hypothetical protein